MGALGTITSEFKVLEKGIADAEKAVKSFGKEMQNALGNGFGNNPALHRIVTKTNFTGGVDKLFDQVKKNKIKAYSGNPMGEDVANELMGQLRHMTGLWAGNRKGPNTNINKMLSNPMERIGKILNTLGVSTEDMVKELSSVKPIKFSSTEMKNAEENIKKYLEGISRHLTEMERVFGSVEKKAGQEFKTAKHQKGASKKQSTTHKKNYVGGSDLRIDSEKYARSEKYRDLADQFISLNNKKAGNYGRMADAALINATLKENKFFMGAGADYRGFWTELRQGFKNGINSGMKDFDLGQILSDTIKKGGKFRRQEKIIKKFGYDSDNLLETSAVLKSKLFKDFAKDKIKELGWQGRNVTNRDILNASSKNEKWQLRQWLRVKDQVDFSSMSKRDKTKILAGLTNNEKATSMMGGMKMGGVFLTAAAGVAKLAEAALNLGKECIAAFEGVEQLKTQLGVVFGSNIQSDKMFADIEAYAKKSPFGVENMTQQAVLLKQSGVYASDLMNTLKRLGDISSGNNEKMKSVSQVYARVMSSQTVTARDMRQLSTAGVPSYSALADSMGIDRGQIRNYLQAGKVSYTDFQNMIKKLTSEGGMFYGATDIGAKTLAARKQNLSDAQQMAKANVGEYLLRQFNPIQLISPVAALLGLGANKTGTVEDGWYSQVLGWLEKINGTIERSAEFANKKMDTEVPEKLKAEYEKQMAIANDPKKSELDRAIAADEAKKLADRWGAAVEKSISSGDWLYNQATTEDENYLKHMEKAYGMHFSSMQELQDQADFADFVLSKNSYTDEYGYLAFEKDLSTLLEEFKKKNPNTTAQAMTEEQLKAVKNGNFYQGAGFDKDDEAFNLVKYRIDHYFTEIVNATQKGVDMMEDQVNNTKDTFDKFGKVNFGKKGIEGYGAQHLMSAAREDYQNNSPVYQMAWKDQKAYWDEQAKKEIDYYSSKTKKGKDAEGNDIYSMAELTAEEMQRAQELLTAAPPEAIQMLANPGNATDIEGRLTDQSRQDINALFDNITELAQVAENSGGEGVFGKNFMDGLTALTDLLKDDEKFGDDAVKNVEKVVDLLNNGLIGSLNTQLETANLPPEAKAALLAMQANVQQSMSTHTYSDDTKNINRRKQASLRAHVLSNVTGVSAERVANSKESSVMNAYLNNFSQRQMFAQLGKALMQNGAELKDVARALQDGGKGDRNHDWRKSENEMEQMAAQKNIATQEALISAYQQQIDALHELTVGSIATRDQWDNLNSLSAQLGVGFELAAKELADGTVQFTDVTIQSAHKMLEELNIKKFNQQMDTILNRVVENLKDKQKEASLETSVLTGGMGHYVTNENAGSYVQVAKGQAAEIAKTEIPVLVNKVWKKNGLVFDSKEGAENQAREFQKLFKDRTIKVQAVTVQEGKEGNFAKLSAIANTRLKDQWEASGKKQSFKDWAYEKVPWKLAGGKEKTRWEIGYSDVLNENGYGRPYFGGGDRGGKANDTNRFYLTSIAGKKESEYKASAREEKTAYKIEGISEQEVEESIRSLVAALNDGTLPKGLASLFLALTGLDQTENELTKKIEDNTAAQSTNDAIKEMHQLSDQFKAYFGSIGIMGNTPEEREAAKLKEESKPFKDMERHSPMMNHANTPDREAMMALLGIDRHTDYEAYRLRRMGEALNFDSIDKNKNKLLDKDDIKGAEREEEGPRKGQIKGLMLKGDEVTQANVKNFLINGEGRGYTRKLFNNKETGYEDEHKTLDSFKDTIENMDSSAIDTLIGKLQDMGVPLEDFVRKMQESSEFTMVANDKIKDMTDTLKDSSFSTAVNLVNSGLKQAGDNAYKLDNNLIKGRDAAKATKQALAGVQAALLESIGAAMTQTGLSIAAGAAKDGLWSMVAMGLALAAAGGVASFGSGMMSAYANDKSKDKSSEEEDRLKRLEDLKNNLADLLKQAKDDAIYYETNLRQKQAVAFNDAVSSTNVNDAIITPRGVVNTAPDDYIMAMKDPTHLLGKGGGGTNVSFSIVNESGTPMTVTRSETREGSGGTEIVAFVNAIVQKSMKDGEYDDVMAGMQVRQKGSQISS